MKVNNTSQQSFKGLYIIKGTGKNVARVTSMICERCSDPIMQQILKDEAASAGFQYKAKKLISDFVGVTYHSLTGYYGETQPLVENIIATNEDISIVDNYQIQNGCFKFLDNMDDFSEAEITILKECFIRELQKFQKDLYSYETAHKKCLETGNSAPLTEFVLKKAIEAKKILNKMLTPHKINPTEIKTLNADAVLDAIYQDKFNYIDGSFKGHI